jgi:hypothetical protein
LVPSDAWSGKASTIQAEHVIKEIKDHHKDGFPSLDYPGPWNNKESDTPVDKVQELNKCGHELYEELLQLQSNPLGLDRFTCKKKVHIELFHVLKVLNAPLKAFTQILKWAAQASNIGHVFKMDCQPSQKNVVQKLYCRHNMKGLIQNETHLYLPYSQRTVSMIYFDASQVFASYLSCPLLNCNEDFLFHAHKDPFVEPSKSGDIGDINTGGY